MDEKQTNSANSSPEEEPKTLSETEQETTKDSAPEQPDPAESKRKKKVELDLDDAPFLEEEKEEPPPVKPEEPAKEELDQEPEPPKTKKKWLIIGGIIGLLLAIGGGVYFWLSSSPKPPPPPPPPKTKPKEKPKPPPPEELKLQLKPFLVQLTTQNATQKRVCFLTLQLTLVTTNDKLVWEANRKKILLRDAIYYYLHNQNYKFFKNTHNLTLLKKNILNVINQYLNNGQFQKILVEKILIK